MVLSNCADITRMALRHARAWQPGRLTLFVIATGLVTSALCQELPTTSDGVDPSAKGSEVAGAAAEISERERKLMGLIAADELPGGFITLGPEGQSFAARLERGHEPASKDALLAIPPYGGFIGVDSLIDAYMDEFAVNGWTVLAVQPPLLPRMAEHGDYDQLAGQAIERIKQAIEFLLADGAEGIVIVGNAEGALLAHQYLVDKRPTGVSGLATVGLWAGAINDIGIPVIEIVAERDVAALKLSKRRKTDTVRLASPQHELVVVAAADSTYMGFENEIAKRVRGWADRVIAAPETSLKTARSQSVKASPR